MGDNAGEGVQAAGVGGGGGIHGVELPTFSHEQGLVGVAAATALIV